MSQTMRAMPSYLVDVGRSLLASSRETVAQQNMLQLIELRWIAVIGQVLTIAFVTVIFRIELPLLSMTLVVCGLVLLNLFSLYRPRKSGDVRSEEHTSELQSLMRISYAVFCLKKKTKQSRHQVKDATQIYCTDQANRQT